MPRKALSTVSRNADRLLPWSYSKLSAYEKCPRAAFFRYIERHPEAKSDALERGNRVHSELEGWAKGGFKKPKVTTWKRFHQEAQRLKLPAQPGVIVEQMWSFNDRLEPVAMRDPDEWLRVKCDLAVPSLALIVDHKTGKKYPEHKEQGRIYGATFLTHFPVDRVAVEFWYIDLGEITGMDVTRAEVPMILSETKIRVRGMIEDVEFKPKPSRLCDWCAFSRTKGGPCKEG